MVKGLKRKSRKSDATTCEGAPALEAAQVSCPSDAVHHLLIPSTKTSSRLKLRDQPKQLARFKERMRKHLSSKLGDFRSGILEAERAVCSSIDAVARALTATSAHGKRRKALSCEYESLHTAQTQLEKLEVEVLPNVLDELEEGVYSLVSQYLEPAFIYLQQETMVAARRLYERVSEQNSTRQGKKVGRVDIGIQSSIDSENRKPGNKGVPEKFDKAISDQTPKLCLVESSLIHGFDESGFYSGEAVNPLDLVQAVTTVRTRMTSFSKCFWKALQAEESAESRAGLTSWYSSVEFIRHQHVVRYGLKASLAKVLYRDFENEDFRSGTIRDLDPRKRRQAFTEYFRRYEDRITDDEQFSCFRQRKLRRLARKFRMRVGLDSQENVTTQILEDLGGSKLLSLFNHVIVGVWFLHKVAFAFLTPASILRFSSSSAVNMEYMDPVEEGNDGFVAVGFTVSPGFRLGQTVIKAEVYPGLKR